MNKVFKTFSDDNNDIDIFAYLIVMGFEETILIVLSHIRDIDVFVEEYSMKAEIARREKWGY